MSKNFSRLDRKSENLIEHPFAHELPYWDFSDEQSTPWVSLSDGSLVMGLRLNGVSIETSDVTAINNLTQGIRAFLSSLPDGVEVQIISDVNSDLSSVIDQHEKLSGDNPLIQWVAKSRIQKLRNAVTSQSLRKTNLYLFVYERPSTQTSAVASFFQKKKLFEQVKREDHEKRLRELRQKTLSIQENLQTVGIDASALSVSEVQRLIYQFLNPNKSRSVSAPTVSNEHRNQEFTPEELALIPELAIPSPREQLSGSTLIQSKESFELDGLHHVLITLKTLPEVTYSCMIESLMKLPLHYSLSVHIKVPDQSKEIASIQTKRRMAHSMSASQGGRASDLESEARLQSTEELLRELLNTGQKVFYFQLSVLLREADKETIEQHSKSVLSKVRELSGAEGLAETVANFKVFKTVLPAGNTAMVRPKRIKSDNLADFLPIYQAPEGHKKPICLFQNRQSGLLKYNDFSETSGNYNRLVTGASGSGKSFLNNCILLQSLTQNPLTYIIDIGGSYRKLCDFMGGQYIDVAPPTDKEAITSINPFELLPDEIEPSPRKVKFLLSLLETMLAEEESERISKLAKGLLEEAIIQTYKEHGSKTRLSFLVQTLKSSPEEILRNFAKMLFPWTGERAYGRLLDSESTLSLGSDFVVFDLKGLSSHPDLQSVMILIITDFILSKVESIKGRKKTILMDECWQLLQSKSSVQFMEYCARTLRKTGSGITFITQGLEEIIDSPIGAAILNNTATKFILLQKGDLEPTRKILKLNDKEMSLISSIKQVKGQYSEAFMISDDIRSIIRITPTPIEYWLATSDANDNILFDNAKNRYPEKSLPDIIYYLATYFPNGSQGRTELIEPKENEAA